MLRNHRESSLRTHVVLIGILLKQNAQLSGQRRRRRIYSGRKFNSVVQMLAVVSWSYIWITTSPAVHVTGFVRQFSSVDSLLGVQVSSDRFCLQKFRPAFPV